MAKHHASVVTTASESGTHNKTTQNLLIELPCACQHLRAAGFGIFEWNANKQNSSANKQNFL